MCAHIHILYLAYTLRKLNFQANFITAKFYCSNKSPILSDIEMTVLLTRFC